MNTQDLHLLRRIVELGSMAAAARELGYSATRVSERLAKLEAYFGVALLNRTTRSIHLTDAGRTLIQGVDPLLADIEALESHIRHGVGALSGLIRVSAPSDLGRSRVSEAITRFQSQHPLVQFELHLSDGYVDLVGSGFDMALRFGDIADSTLRSRTLWRGDRVVCAAPSYVKSMGLPSDPDDLKHHRCLVMRFGDLLDNQWRFKTARSTKTVVVRGDRIANDGQLVKTWCLDGAGIALKSLLDVSEELRSGKLVQVLKTTAHATPLQLLFPPSRRQPNRVRHFADCLASQLADA